MRLRIARLIWAICDWNEKSNERLQEFGCYIVDGKNWRTKYDPR